jgi:DNA-binding response OmpR family regulator
MAKPRILFVEDYPVVRDMYIKVLKDEDFEIESVDDGKDALRKIREKHYDIILLDLLLPQVTGTEFLRTYNKGGHKQDDKTSIVVLTDFDKPETKADVMKLGVKHYWIKVENTPHTLASRLKKVLAGEEA